MVEGLKRWLCLAICLASTAACRTHAPVPTKVAEQSVDPELVFACPPGAEMVGSPPPVGYGLWCRDEKGRRHGPFVQWDDNGRKRLLGNYHDGKRAGRWIQWGVAGEKISEQDYRDDLLHGVERTWYATGQLKMRREYRRGKPHGQTVYYRPDGSVAGEATYADGDLVSRQ